MVVIVDSLSSSPADRPVEHGDFGYDTGLVAARRLLDRRPDLTAVFAASDEMAAAALAVADEQGRRVPDDLSVIGFDAIPLVRMTRPPLVSVAQPLRQMGYRAMQAAEQLVRGDHLVSTDPVTHTLTAGGTVGPAPSP